MEKGSRELFYALLVLGRLMRGSHLTQISATAAGQVLGLSTPARLRSDCRASTIAFLTCPGNLSPTIRISGPGDWCGSLCVFEALCVYRTLPFSPYLCTFVLSESMSMSVLVSVLYILDPKSHNFNRVPMPLQVPFKGWQMKFAPSLPQRTVPARLTPK